MSWLEKPIQDAYARDEAIEQIKEDLWKEYKPYSARSIIEALNELSEEELNEIDTALKSNNAGDLLVSCAMHYWEDQIEDMAIDRFERGSF